ncbi:MAG TPA: GNAT family N-acetyltransferase [Ilumatobacteraceae bacterium]|nr:GNAT family N-acetyltransferase [Ilumatobacteraceae bacterium]
MFVRRFAEPDTPVLYDVCRRTADAGDDATHLHHEPSLLGHVWLGPYLTLEPELAWVVDGGSGRPLGYVVGTVDTVAFEEALERSWWPELRALYPETADRDGMLTSADEALIRTIHHPYAQQREVVEDHPSHLHIDLLPEAQGAGFGRVLIDTLCAALAARGSTGVFVSVGALNTRALAFYRHVAFVDLLANDGAVWLGRRLIRDAAGAPAATSRRPRR